MAIYLDVRYPRVLFCDCIQDIYRDRRGFSYMREASLVLERDPNDPEHSFKVLKDRMTGEIGIWVDDLYYKEY